MDIERLRNIIQYRDMHKEDIEAKVQKFYSFAGMSSDKEVLNIMQIVRSALKEKGYLVLEIPFADEEIGALCYKGDAVGYIVLNTSLPKVNVNFAVCHEVYHVFYQKAKTRQKIEFKNENYDIPEEEFAANLFAGMLLMPETGFRHMYHKFRDESGENGREAIFRLMNYYQAPYMAVLVRCYELELLDMKMISEELWKADLGSIREKFIELWLDTSILDATKKDDYPYLEVLVDRFGKEYINEAYLNERTLQKVLRNMRTLYFEIKGE